MLGPLNMPDVQLIEILIAAMVAGVVLFRLYTILGRRTGHEPQDRLAPSAASSALRPPQARKRPGPARLDAAQNTVHGRIVAGPGRLDELLVSPHGRCAPCSLT